MIQPFSQGLAQDILKEIQKTQNIIMHCHPGPDADSMGSTLAMKFALQAMGKSVTLIKGDSDLPKYLSSLPGYDSVVLKNIFELDLTQFDLYLILDTGGINQISKIKNVEFPESLQTIVIDHHISNKGFAKINLVDATYPSTCEIVFELFKEWGIEITHDIALCLYAGMYSDTGGFVYPTTSPRTMHIAAALADKAPEFNSMIFTMMNNNTPGRLQAQGLLYSSIETWFSNSIAVSSLSYEDIQKIDAKPDDIAGLDVANNLKSVVGWNVGISMIETEPGVVKISSRSRDGDVWDVSKIMTAMGGGGHKAAAGGRVEGTIEEAKTKLKSAILEVYPDLK
ncbi:MAG: DHH family phosphoesterase [Patescibacteria group bacterium]